MKTFSAYAAIVLSATAYEAGVGIGLIGSTPVTSLVHKADHEGSITIDPVTGNILTLLADRPEWAEGLTVAQITERHKYYGQALGPQYTEGMKAPDIFAFEDLAWLAVRSLDYDDEQTAKALADDPNFDGFEHFELDASEEFRAEVVATILGIKGDIDTMEAELIAGGENAQTVDLSAELLADNLRSQEEIEAFERSQEAGADRAHG